MFFTVLATVRKEGLRLLSEKSSEDGFFVQTATPQLDCDCFLSWLLEIPRSRIFSHPEMRLSEQQETAFFDAVRRRRVGLPVAYITGHKEFWNLDFCVNEAVLIPKPDTELLVEHALQVIRRIVSEKVHKKKSQAFERISDCRSFSEAENSHLIYAADICTGSGCIAVSVLHTLLQERVLLSDNLNGVNQNESFYIQMYASDISNDALSVAYENATRLLPAYTVVNSSDKIVGTDNFCKYNGGIIGHMLELVQGDLLKPFSDMFDFSQDGIFDLIVSNPPYVPATVTQELLADGRSEPVFALNGDCDGSVDGTGLIQRLIPQVYRALKRGAFFLIETGEYNAAATAMYLAKNGFTDIVTYTDLGGLPRVTLAKKI